MNAIIGIDPGPQQSAYAALLCSERDSKVYFADYIGERAKVPNDELLEWLRTEVPSGATVAIEMVESFGKPVGRDVFDTVFWVGRFYQQARCKRELVYRKKIKLHFCQSLRAKDTNIMTALVDRFDPQREYGKYGKGTKKRPGPLYGFRADMWSALAVALYARDDNWNWKGGRNE